MPIFNTEYKAPKKFYPARRLDQATDKIIYDLGSNTYYGLSISEDGNYLYVGDNYGVTIKQYSLSTPYDVTTATYVSSVVGVSGQHGVYISPNGLKLFGVGHENTSAIEYTLQSANSLTGATSTTYSLSNPRGGVGIGFNSDGTSAFISNFTNSCVYKLSCPTAYSLSGNTLSQTEPLGYRPRGVGLSNDGLHLFVGNGTNMAQWNLTTKDDITTASAAYSYATGSGTEDCYAGTITKDGRYFYFIYGGRYVARVTMPGSYYSDF